MIFLFRSQCPVLLALRLARAVSLDCQTSGAIKDLQDDDHLSMDSYCLAAHVHGTLVDIARRWSTSGLPPSSRLSPRPYTVSSHAIRNTRRKMEDRHTVIPDLCALYGFECTEPLSFYGVYDGHGGVEAAVYAAAHLHQNLARSAFLETDPDQALLEAYRKTDLNFLARARTAGLRSGSTGVSALIRGNKLYLCWLGDSQAMLVRNGTDVMLMEPHKPEREDERRRIEGLGGVVVWYGAWRVNGSLSVSRAIGDCEHKPFVSGEADVSLTELDGNEDYLLLACDGLWDVLSPRHAIDIVYQHVLDNDVHSAAQNLVNAAKENGSNDNISVVLVFFREQIAKPPHFDSDIEFESGTDTLEDSPEKAGVKFEENGFEKLSVESEEDESNLFVEPNAEGDKFAVGADFADGAVQNIPDSESPR